ncbi:MAG: VOC family protein [Acidobacteriota bacterium]|nr:VOC family protein [Acidobacteriota bacterium]
MSHPVKPPVGSIGWIDLTVNDAAGLQEFYQQVTGWVAAPVDMGDYNDFNLQRPDTATPVAGICHARGANQGLPAQWLIYIVVADLDASIERCESLGGKVLAGPKGQPGHDRYCVIEDPAGAVAALYQAAAG